MRPEVSAASGCLEHAVTYKASAGALSPYAGRYLEKFYHFKRPRSCEPGQWRSRARWRSPSQIERFRRATGAAGLCDAQ